MENAIERRLKRIDQIWNDSASTQLNRLIVFRGSSSDIQLLDLHIEIQGDTSELPDIFLRLKSDFTDLSTYDRLLIDEFTNHYEECRAELNGVFGFTPQPLNISHKKDTFDLLSAINQFVENYGENFRFIAIILSPESIANVTSFYNWLVNLAYRSQSEVVRFVLFERLDAPLVPGIEEAMPDRIQEVLVDLEMQGAFEELARGEGNDGPGKDFQLHMLGIASAAEQGNLDAARRSAWKARSVARTQCWPDQEVVAHATFGAALISARHFDEAINVYQAAEPIAEKLCEDGHPAGPKLLLTIKISGASALFAAEKLGQAAAKYEDSAQTAVELNDLLMALDSWRMTGYCHEALGQKAEAWRGNQAAIEIAKRLVRSAREATSLAYVGDALLRLVSELPNAQENIQRVNEQMVDLLDEAWNAHLEAVEATEPRGVA